MFSVGSINGNYEYQRDIPTFAAAKIAAMRIAQQLGSAVAIYNSMYKCMEIVY